MGTGRPPKAARAAWAAAAARLSYTLPRMISDSAAAFSVASGTAGFDVFDVHLHARPPEAFLGVARARFGRHAQTAGTNVTDAAALLEQTLAQMDRSGVRRGLVTGVEPRLSEARPGSARGAAVTGLTLCLSRV